MMVYSSKEQLKCTRCNEYFCYERNLKRISITCGFKLRITKMLFEVHNVLIYAGIRYRAITNEKLLKLHLEADYGVQLQNEQQTYATINGKCDY